MIRKTAIFLLAAGLLLPVSLAAEDKEPVTNVKVGEEAPDFELRDQNGKTFRLSEQRGKRQVVLAFYVLAFTGG
jgi:cytochrome oxidase Cu insertion factor (SCO1/SenC/PrrC family)